MNNLIYLLLFTPFIVVSQSLTINGSTGGSIDFQYIIPDVTSPWLGDASVLGLTDEIEYLTGSGGNSGKNKQWCLSAKVVITSSSAAMNANTRSGTIIASLDNSLAGFYTGPTGTGANSNNLDITLTSIYQQWFSGKGEMGQPRGEIAKITYRLINPWMTMPTSTVTYKVYYQVSTGYCN
tara:strand:- start:167 stop:706 length:540 start_codon:yes stop_codon:yes gene_type:complete